MNTRIQVEHPVSECITGLDLMREMIRIADGSRLPFTQDDIRMKGHAIEVRINAEDPARDFAPFPGTVSELRVPGGPGVRFDSMLYRGYTVSPFYDSLLGKLIVWDEDRAHALARLAGALDELEIAGVTTTKALYQALVRDEDVRRAHFHTGWLETWLENNFSQLAAKQEVAAS
jgi:acetyl-CoA carboxylase, biotin carboxylase subunit